MSDTLATLLDGLAGAIIGGVVTAATVVYGLRRDRRSAREERLIELSLQVLGDLGGISESFMTSPIKWTAAREAAGRNVRVLGLLARSTHPALSRALNAALKGPAPEQVDAVKDAIEEWLEDTSARRIGKR